MSDKGIIFSAPMVRALLDGRKTQTRRLIKPQPPERVTSAGNYSNSREGATNQWSWLSGDPRDIDTWEFEGDFRVPYTLGDRLHPLLPIPSLNRNYAADTLGNIWSRARDGKTWSPLKASPSSRGYLTVTPAHEGKYRTRAVHRLIAEAFYGDQGGQYPVIRHLDGDQQNNAPDNIDWGTIEDNWSDRIAHGNAGGETHHDAKLTRETAAEIRASALSQRALAKKYGVAQSTIWAAKNNRLWIDDGKPNPPNFPRWTSRLTLIVTDVRVQRVAEISEADAIAEGISVTDRQQGQAFYHDPIADFRDLWNSLHDKPGERWEDSPWVVAVSFDVKHGNIDRNGP